MASSLANKILSSTASKLGVSTATAKAALNAVQRKAYSTSSAATAKATTSTAKSSSGSGSSSKASSSGSSSGGTLSADAIKTKMAQNSAAWHGADAATQDALHQENVRLAQQLDTLTGGSSTFNSSSGTWNLSSGGGAAAQAQVTPQVQGYTQDQLDNAIQLAVSQAKSEWDKSQYALTEYLKAQKAAELESSLAGLKGAYEKSVSGLQSARDRLPQTYEAARNQAAAQDALARRAFDERAAASGLATGAAGQAELARSSALQSALAGINREQANAEADVDLQLASLKTQYETAVQQARASGNSALANALYQELVRVQGLERSDTQTAQQRADAQEQLAYNRAKAEAQTAYTQEQTARTEAQKRIGAYLAALGRASDLDGGLVAQSGYTQAELTALEQFYAQQAATAQAQQAASAAKPLLTAAQVNTAIKAGNLTPNVLSAYEYYYGTPYAGGMSGTGGTTGRTGGQGGTPTGSAGVGNGYDNGSLSTDQVKTLQTALGVTADGFYGPVTRKAAGNVDADTAWAKYQRTADVPPAITAEENQAVVNAIQQGYNSLSATGRSLYSLINTASGVTTLEKKAALEAARSKITGEEYDFLSALL